MTAGPVAATLLPRAPLDPGADEARRQLRRELLDPAYRDRDVVGRVLDWVGRQVDRLTGTAASAPPLVTLASMILLVGLVAGVAWLVSRARWSRAREGDRAVLAAGEVVRADDLADRARRALGDGDARTALVEGFRAVAVRGVERGVLADLPGATAREVSAALAAALPERSADARAAAEAFDAALYGARDPDAPLAERVLALDRWLREAGSVPRPAAGTASPSGGATPGGRA